MSRSLECIGRLSLTEQGRIYPTPPVSRAQSQTRARQLLLGLSLILVAFNLRPLFGSLSVLLPEVMKDTGLTPTGASMLTTLPLLCLGIFAAPTPALERLGCRQADGRVAGRSRRLTSPAREGSRRHIRARVSRCAPPAIPYADATTAGGFHLPVSASAFGE
jgi:hypothetical protein